MICIYTGVFSYYYSLIMKVAIATESTPKVDAVKSVVAQAPYFDKVRDSVGYVLKSVSSDVSDMPLSLEETIAGAKNRVTNLRTALENEWIKADLYIGLEWWAMSIGSRKYVGWVAYVEDKKWDWHLWFSGMMEVPAVIEKELYENWRELWPVMSELAGVVNIKSKNGSTAAWSDDMIDRQSEFELALKQAIAPFYNQYYKL